jgi:HSP20 family protein
MLYRFDPFRELERFGGHGGDGRRVQALPMDAYRAGDDVRVDFDMPGVDPASIEVSVEKDVLTASATRQWSSEGVEVLVSKRPQGTFSRTMYLGESLHSEHIEASYTDGVLCLRIPVRPAARPRRVTVSATPKSEPVATSAN